MKHKREDAPNRRIALVVAAVAIIIALAAAVLAFQQCSRQDDGMEPNVVVGSMEGYTDEEIAEMLKKKVDEGMISFSLNTHLYLDGPDAQASIKFENPANNAKLTKLRLVRDDTGEQIYETGFLEPGSYVDADQLDARLGPGEYACTGYITSYEQGTKRFLGEAACTVHVTVMG